MILANLAAGVVWTVGLALALGSAEILVRSLTRIGAKLCFSAALLGLLVALGADAPEVTSALVANIGGHYEVGLGVVLGSNIYNLAGLLGLSALIAGHVYTSRQMLTPDGAVNGLLTLLLIGLVALPAAHTVLGTVLLVVVFAYVVIVSRATVVSKERPPKQERIVDSKTILIAGAAVALIVLGSTLLVQSSAYLAPRFGIPADVTGTFVLAIATSLPNTWAVISLARRHMDAEAIATTFNSNSINIAVGVGLPSLVVALHEPSRVLPIDIGWLVGMTALVMLALALRSAVYKLEGLILIVLYIAFAVVRIAFFS